MEYKLPELGENVSEGTIAKVLIKNGDVVSEGQPLLELETDKAVLEVPSTINGKVQNIKVTAGGKAKVGETIFDYEESTGAQPAKIPAAPAQPAAAPKTESAKKAAPAVTGGVTEYKLPELGEGVAGGTIAKVLVKDGESISEGQAIVELETDKAVLEVPSTVSGKIVKVSVQAGGKIKVGETVFTYEGGVAAGEPAQQASAESNGDSQPDKNPAATDPNPAGVAQSPANGRAGSPSQPSGALPASGALGESALPTGGQPTGGQPVPSGSGPVPAAPSTRRLARELGVDIHQVRGSGPAGRISEKDVKGHVKSAMQSGGAFAGAPAGAPVLAVPLPDFSKWGDVERQELSGIRRATAAQMTRSWSAPHVTQFDKADITDLEAFRRNYAKKSGIKITVTALLLKVAVTALKKFPQFNSSLDLNAGELVLKKYFHIGVAVDTGRGLLVPVIRDANQKSVTDLAVEVGETAKRARDRKLSLEEMQGGCFTITNLGGIGGTQFTPIVNAPEVAILGVARGGMEPVWNGKEFEPRFMLPLSLSYDHRVIDGADGARFLRYICEVLENPVLLALEG